MTCSSGPVIEVRDYPDHPLTDRHSFHQLLLGQTGMVELEVGGRPVRVGEGVVAPVACDSWHHYLAPADNRILVLDLAVAWCEALDIASLFDTSRSGGWQLPSSLTQQAAQLHQQPAAAAAWLGRVAQYVGEHAGSALSTPRLSLLKLLPVLRRELGHNWQVAEMARLCHLSEAAFARQFRALTGLAPHQWLKHERLGEARRLMLASPTVTLTEIALHCGFHDAAHFSRTFRQAYGCSPREWRQEVRN
ncbi:helix-turn-helix transcriptional regulator [Halomonas huangheensis]|uniref:HTH araC/xylS-type domain-containing protein n=1 Tax=Halomonas huangheensis TaxID=1178482 RepID=W1N9W0_9GAMM|nr:AraC family transcriptional regulator [Halomonas huangheensis]ALM53780.1 hypothetical protein AR456_16990 [Halomonas huangheensis]ERL52294.1 hypothetical protein BJB45_10020 [Halomonas huangheensis]